MEDTDKRRISPETVSLTLIALVDCSTTAWLIRSGLAVEGNPVVRFYINMGWAWFFGLKLMVLAPMYLIDLHRAIDRKRLRIYMRAAVLVYAGIYGFGMLAQYSRFAKHPVTPTSASTVLSTTVAERDQSAETSPLQR